MVENSLGRSPFYDDGSPRFTGEYLDSQMHGEWKFFRKDGSLMRSGSFENGNQIGVWRTFDREGKLVSEKDFG